MSRSMFPEVVTGYDLAPRYGWFSVLEPATMTNLVKNPSFELDAVNPTATAYYTADNATLAVTSTYQRRGTYSLSVTPSAPFAATDGVLYNIPNDELDAGVTYNFGVDILGKDGYKYEVIVVDATSKIVARSGVFTSNGYWLRKNVRFVYTDVPYVNSINVIRVAPLNAQPFYVDGYLITEGQEITTYFDGDTQSYTPDSGGYQWMGAPHLSISRRRSDELSTGIIRNLGDYGLHILGVQGLGLVPQDMTIDTVPLLGGGTYQRGIDKQREFTIMGSVSKGNLLNVLLARSKIEKLLRQTHTLQQPITVRMQLLDDCGEMFSEPVHMRSLYAGGLEAVTDNLYQERFAMQFIMDRPKILVDGDEGGNIDTLTEMSTATGLINRLVRKSGYEWDNWDGGCSAAVWVIRHDKHHNRIYLGGNFTTIGTAPLVANRFCYWDLETEAFTALDYTSGANDDVVAIEIAGNGNVYVGGEFSDFEGVSASVVFYDFPSATWTDGSMAFTDDVLDMHFAPNGTTLYVVTINGVFQVETTCDPLIAFSVSQIATLASPGEALCVNVDKDGVPYVGGTFTAINGDSANAIAWYDADTSTWMPLGSGMAESGGTPTVREIEFGDDGLMYVAGNFTSADGVSAKNIVMWNGDTFFPLGNGITDYIATEGLCWNSGKLYVLISGTPGSRYPYDRTTAEGIATWNGNNWMHIDFSLESTGDLTAIEFDYDNNIYIGGNFNFDGCNASGRANVVNSGSADALPVIEIRGEEDEELEGASNEWRLLWIKNESTGHIIFTDLIINCEETISVDLRRNRRLLWSSTRGNINNTILPGSELSNFTLAPGNNVITVFVATGILKNRIYWPITHDYLGGAVYD